MNDDMRIAIREGMRDAMKEGGKIALDSAVRLIGRLVQQFTVSGHPQEAAGASGEMELMKQLRDSAPDLYAAHDSDAWPEGNR